MKKLLIIIGIILLIPLGFWLDKNYIEWQMRDQLKEDIFAETIDYDELHPPLALKMIDKIHPDSYVYTDDETPLIVTGKLTVDYDHAPVIWPTIFVQNWSENTDEYISIQYNADDKIITMYDGLTDDSIIFEGTWYEWRDFLLRGTYIDWPPVESTIKFDKEVWGDGEKVIYDGEVLFNQTVEFNQDATYKGDVYYDGDVYIEEGDTYIGHQVAGDDFCDGEIYRKGFCYYKK